MLGNCATGRLRMVIMPTITITMEMTMATIGLLMKNFDIALPSLRFGDKRRGIHLHARTHLQAPFDNHPFAALQLFLNNPLPADTIADFDRASAHFVFV